jgi:predicted AlkP superfamily pyrophosphatase or phosphodiesterase
MQKGFYLFLLIISSLVIIFAMITAFLNFFKKKKIYSAVFISLLFIFFASLFLPLQLHSGKTVNQSNKPNVILILTDSLRPDFYDNKKTNNDYPNLSNVLKKSFYFTNAFTTLGRSTPGLVTILTGKYPKNSGARFNLINNKNINFDNSLNEILKKEGYKTI